MVFVQNSFGSGDVAAFPCSLPPRHRHEPIEIVPGHGRLRRHRRHGFDALELDDGFILGLGRHPRLGDTRAKLVGLVPFAVFLAELLLNRLHLFVEVVLLLGTLHLLANAALDPPVDLELVHFELEDAGDARQSFEGVPDLEQILLFLDRHHQV